MFAFSKTSGIAALAALSLLVQAEPAVAKSNFTVNSGKKTWTVKAGPIWNQADAERKCPKAARSAGAYWTGQWWTTKPGKMSVCQVSAKKSRKKTIEVGPIWNQSDAERKCPKAARKIGAKWTGQWWTTVPGVMSVCEVQKKR